ncbi:hypothetical protein AMECASPLE_021919 [Ameca splendens]|uniref:Uncharacterized protein n=1 Tax=Ameca splendens TaxID=208324 RepID=A0ABV0ZCZ8_9TELE
MWSLCYEHLDQLSIDGAAKLAGVSPWAVVEVAVMLWGHGGGCRHRVRATGHHNPPEERLRGTTQQPQYKSNRELQ